MLEKWVFFSHVFAEKNTQKKESVHFCAKEKKITPHFIFLLSLDTKLLQMAN